MAETWVTRCPQCGTSFRLTKSQLNAANGSVRCGSCLHVFLATNYLISDNHFYQAQSPQPPTKPSVSTPSTKTAPTPAPLTDNVDTLDEEKELLIHDDMDAGDTELSDDMLALGNKPKSGKPQLQQKPDTNQEKAKSTDESWALALLEELEQEEQREAEVINKYTAQKKAHEHKPAPIAKPPIAKIAQPPAPTKPSQPQTPRIKQTTEEPAVTTQPIIATPKSTDLYDDTGTDNQQAAQTSPDNATSKHDLLGDLRAEPIELVYPGRFPWLKKVAWLAVNLIAIAAIGAQVAWYNFDQYATKVRWRPYYAATCQWLGCQLPPLVDVGKIVSRKLIVRSHPNYQDALVIDTVIINKARFQQPFPVIEFSFSDLSGQPVATRQFQPDEYLSGEAAGLTMIPSNVPVRLSLDVVDPGPNAVNYNISFSPILN